MNPRQARLEFINRRIDLQSQKFAQALDRFSLRDKALFGRMTDAMIKKDQHRFTMFRDELKEVREMQKQILTSKIALGEVHKRIQGQAKVESPDEGDLMVAAQLLTNARNRVTKMFPEAENEIGEIYCMLSSIIVDVFIEGTNNKSVIKEMYDRVELEAVNQMKDKLPSIPDMPASP